MLPPDAPPPPDLRRSAGAVALANGLSRISGLVREVVFAAAFGASPAADAWNAAFRVGSLFRELFAEGALTSAFVPAYAKAAEADPQEGWRLVNALLGVLLLVLGAVTLLTLALADPLVRAFAGGFVEDPSKLALTVSLTRALSPFVALISVASVFMGMLNVRGRFFGPTLSPVLLNVAVIAACLGAPRWEQLTGQAPIFVVAWASLLGGLGQSLVLLPSLRRAGFRLRPSLRGHPALQGMLAFFAPALVAISVTQLHLLIETQLASREGDGAVSWLLYAFRVAHLPLSVVSLSVGVAALAGLSVLHARGDREGFREAFLSASRINSFLSVPAAVLLYFIAEPSVSLLFERGAFTAQDSAQTAVLLQAYAAGIWGIGAQRVMVVAFYAAGQPGRPMLVGLGLLLLKVPLAFALMQVFGLSGVPLSHAVLATVEVLLLLGFMNQGVGGLWGPWGLFHLRCWAGALGLAAALYGVSLLAQGPIMLLLMPAVGGVAWLVLAKILGIGELDMILARLRKPRPPRP